MTAKGSYGGAGIGGGAGGSGGIITISGGTVTAEVGVGVGIGSSYGGSGAGTITISGGSINSTIFPRPQNSTGDFVYRGKLENQSNVQSVSVDGQSFGIDANHNGDDSLYLYMRGEDHEVDVQTDSVTKRYTATWDNDTTGFDFDSGTAQGELEPTGVFLEFSKNNICYGSSGSITITAEVNDETVNSLLTGRMAGLNQAAFYMGAEEEPFAIEPVTNKKATVTLDISGWNAGDYVIKAKYGGSFGGEASESASATLKIIKATPTADDLSYTIPQNRIYNGSAWKSVTVDSKKPGIDVSEVKYGGNTAVPVSAGN